MSEFKTRTLLITADQLRPIVANLLVIDIHTVHKVAT